MAILEIFEKRKVLESDLYVSVVVAVVNPRDTSKSLQYLSEKLPLDMYGVNIMT